jgi:hypothetical protein
MRKSLILGCLVLGMEWGGLAPVWAGDPFLYEPVHNSVGPGSAAHLSSLPGFGFLFPDQVIVIQVEGDESHKTPDGIFRILNDTGFTITALHWVIPPTGDPSISPGTPVLDEDPVPEGWVQPDVAFGDVSGDGQAGKSDIYGCIEPEGPGPFSELHFACGEIPHGSYFTGHVQFPGDSVPKHYALVWYSVD